ncbi:MAG: hypothetical protein JXR67_13440 [Bacteroidales bacterium]|nr:hypothetical protein [Bacteroidales bacterium]
MKTVSTNQTGKKNEILAGLLPFHIFFLGSFVFFAFLADYIGFFQEKQSLFIFSRDYLNDTIRQPGSLLVYLGRLLTTFCYYPAAGGFFISLIIFLLILMTSRIITLLSGRSSILLPLIAGTLFFILQGNYQYLVYNNLGILLQLILFYVSVKYLKGFLPVILFPFWYLLTGGFAWIFALMYSLYLLRKSLKQEWSKILTLFAVILILIWLLEEFFLFFPFLSLATYPLSPEGVGAQKVLFAVAAGFVILLPVLAGIIIKLPLFMRRLEPRKMIILSIAAVFLVGIPAVLRYNRVYDEYFKAEKLFSQEKYRELISFTDKHPSTNRLTIYLNNIALCETGNLNEKLFHYPQSPDGQSLFLKWEMYGEVLRRGAYFYYTTGMINEAERWAFENMVMKGIAPGDLKILIKSEIINGNYTMASKYVSMLCRTFAYRKEAKEYLMLLTDTTLIAGHPEIGVKRNEKIEQDFFSITDNPYANIELAFEADTFNRKLYDYRMAFHMLTENYEGIAAGLESLERLGYKNIPVHIQEAALVSRMSGLSLSGVGSLRIDPQTEARFTQFLQTFNSYGNNLKTAQPALRQRFGDTFWYYAFYH